MATYEVTGPDGGMYEITAPDNASEADVMAYAQSNYQSAAPELSTSENLMGGLNAFGQGVTMGGLDEISSVVKAGIEDISDWSDDGEDFSDIYSREQAIDKSEREAFALANPKTALGLELAGGFATGGAGTARALGSQLLKNAPKLVRALSVPAVGGAQGGIAGALTSDADERLGGAATGAAIGTTLGGALSGTKGLVNALSKRRIEDDLIQQSGTAEGRFRSLNMDENSGAIGDVYRDIFGKSYGGRGKLIEQSAPFVSRAEAGVGVATRALNAAKEAVSDVGIGMKKRANLTAKSEIGEAQSLYDDAMQVAEEVKRKNVFSANTAADLLETKAVTSATQGAARAEQLAEEGLLAAEKAAERGTSSALYSMQREIVNNAIPDSVPAAVRAKIRSSSNVEQAAKRVNDSWKNYGWKSIENKSYTVDTKLAAIETDMLKALGDDPALLAAAGGYKSVLNGMAANIKNGKLSGVQLMEMRNQLKDLAGSGIGRDVLKVKAFGKMADVVDDKMRQNMSATEMANFDSELSKYGNKLVLRESVVAARTKNAGLPDETNVIAANRKARGAAYGEGLGSGQQAAQNVQKTRAAGKKAVADEKAAGGLAKTKAKMLGADDTATARAEANSIKTTAENTEALTLNEIKTAEKTALTQATKIANAKGARMKANIPKMGKARVDRLVNRVANAKDKASAIKKLAPVERASVLERMAATGVLGGGFQIANLLTATLLARGVTSKGFQTAVAGQTGMQKALAEVLRKQGTNLDTAIGVTARTAAQQSSGNE